MENDIWNEISSFLNQLRCENINREYLFPRTCKYSVEEENGKRKGE